VVEAWLYHSEEWLPVIFLMIMALSMLAYVILDGYDLGVGLFLPWVPDDEQTLMIGSIGPFWDANETWLVLGVGILLVAFPSAHGAILTALYLPVALMLLGLILRGVSFEFRTKAPLYFKQTWTYLFFLGSALATWSQGYMLGSLVLGLNLTLWGHFFAALVGLSFFAAYAWVGAGWLIMKTTGPLQLKAVRWSKWALLGCAVGVGMISVATPLASSLVFNKWFQPEVLPLLLPIPLMTLAFFAIAWRSLSRLPVRLSTQNEYGIWVPFFCTLAIFCLSFYGLAYSFFPYVVPGEMTVWEAAASKEALTIILVGAVVVLPVIITYTILSYRVFHGKAEPLSYE